MNLIMKRVFNLAPNISLQCPHEDCLNHTQKWETQNLEMDTSQSSMHMLPTLLCQKLPLPKRHQNKSMSTHGRRSRKKMTWQVKAEGVVSPFLDSTIKQFFLQSHQYLQINIIQPKFSKKLQLQLKILNYIQSVKLMSEKHPIF